MIKYCCIEDSVLLEFEDAVYGAVIVRIRIKSTPQHLFFSIPVKTIKDGIHAGYYQIHISFTSLTEKVRPSERKLFVGLEKANHCQR